MPALLAFTAAGANQLLVGVSLKAALILAFASVVAWLLARLRCSAAARHATWSIAIASVLALPFTEALLPAWTIPLGWPQPGLSLAAHEPLPLQPVMSNASIAMPYDSARVPASGLSEPVESWPAADAAIVAPGRSVTLIGSLDLSSWPWVMLAWLIGVCLSFAPAAAGLLSLWRLGRTSRQVKSGPLQTALCKALAQLGLTTEIRLLESDARSMPMTWGTWRPTILLPSQAHRWPCERLRIVLLHELAHVQRRDCLLQILAHIARALYWFNPLSWIAARQLQLLQEQACDDRVLMAGCEPPEYAEHLLAIATDCQSLVPAAGVAMARPSQLERRLVAILTPRQDRRPVSRRIALAALMVAVLLSPLAAIRIDGTAAAQQPGNQAAAQQNQPSAQTPDHALALTELRAKIADQFVTPVDDKAMLQGALKGMIDALGDPHSGYLAPDDVARMEQQISGSLVGIGVQLEMRAGQVGVTTPLVNSPALKAGILPGDVILQVDGQAMAGLDLPLVVKRIAGAEGTSVRLKLDRGGSEIDIIVTRGPIVMPTVKGFLRLPDQEWNFMLNSAHQIGYAQIAHFGTTTPKEMRTALESLQRQNVRGMILDLRFCPGGTLESAVAVAKQFIASGTIVSLHARAGEPTQMQADGSAVLGDTPLVVLVNGQTASASEVLAGALQDQRRAVVAGTRTFGKGSVQTLIKLGDESGAIRLTTSEYRLPSGRNLQRRAGEQSWGVNASEGYFVALDAGQNQALLARRQQREIAGRKADPAAAAPAEVTQSWIEEQQADPQLAAALKTMVARLETGAFAKVSELTAAQIDRLLKRQDIEERRAVALKNLQELDRELANVP